jgi:hypothetical protein
MELAWCSGLGSELGWGYCLRLTTIDYYNIGGWVSAGTVGCMRFRGKGIRIFLGGLTGVSAFGDGVDDTSRSEARGGASDFLAWPRLDGVALGGSREAVRNLSAKIS